MKRKFLSLLLVLTMVISLLPIKVSAYPAYKLYFGGTNVTQNTDEISYWKADADDYSNTGNESDYDFSVSYNSDTESFTLTLNGVNITSYYNQDDHDFCIFSNTSLNIFLVSGTENIIDMPPSNAFDSNGIYVGGTLTISGDGSLSSSGGTYGIIAWGWEAGLDITGGTISASGTAYGILVDGDVTISDGDVTATTTNGGYDGIAATGDLTVSGGSVIASGNRSALAVNGSTSVTRTSYKYKTSTDTSAPETDYTYYPGTEFANSEAFRYVEIIGLNAVYIGNTVVSTITDATTYWLNDGDGGITKTGANENNYNAKYDTSSKALILNGLDLTDCYTINYDYYQESCGIYSTIPLNIIIAEGSYNRINTVTTENAMSINIKAEDNITVGGNGTLSLHAEAKADEDSSACGIYSYGGITITGGAIIATAGDTIGNEGLSANGDITIEGGSVFINANNARYGCGMYTPEGDITISGGTVIALADECYSGYGIKSYGGNIDITGGAVYATSNGAEAAIYTNFGEITPSAPFNKAVVIMTDSESYIPTVLYNQDVIPEMDDDDILFTGGFPFAYDEEVLWLTEPDKLYGNFDASPDHDYTWSSVYSPTYEAFDLTLNGIDIANYSDNDRAIETNCGLNVMLKGENTIGTEADPFAKGIYCTDNLIVYAENGGSLDIYATDAGINADSAVSFESGDITIITDDTGIQITDGGFTLSGGNVSITAGEIGIQTEGIGDIMVFGSETILNITAGEADENDEFYGILCDDGVVTIINASVTIDKLGEYGDGVWARSDIRISGDSTVEIIDWSERDIMVDCGLHSHSGNIAIGGLSEVDIVSQSIGIYTKYADETYGDIYIGYEWDGSGYYRSGSPTVKINNENSIEAVTPQSDDDFEAGSYGIRAAHDVHIAGKIEVNTNTENESCGIYADNILEINGGRVTAFGTEQALYAGGEVEPITVNMPTYRYRTNTEAAVPTTPFSYYPDTPFDVSSVESYKYVYITAFEIGPVNVTFNSNDDVHSTKTVNTGGSIGTADWPANPTRSGYTFGGWFTGENGTGTEFTSATQVDSAMTVYAKWTYSGDNGDDGDDGGSGGSGGSNSTPPPTPKTIAVTETSSEVFKDSKGAITAEANMDNAFSNSVEVKVTDTAVDAANFKLSPDDEVYPFDISLYIKGTNTRTQPAPGYAVTIYLPIPENLLDKKELLDVMHRSDDGVVATLSSRLVQKEGIWYLVFEATEFSPYALVVRNSVTYDESMGVPYYLDANGNKVFIGFAANGRYIPPEGVTVSFTHNEKNFTDIIGHWAKSSIDFTTERELFYGTGGNKFSPYTGMTRGMFATVIGRLYERSFSEIKAPAAKTFTDCDNHAYYGKYIVWASGNDIISGYGNGKFGPDDQITREQMAAIIYRFADFLGILPGEMDDTLKYPDAANISGYASNAALYCQTTGILAGRAGGMFSPKGTATRAEVAIIIKRFIETVMQ